MNLFHRHERELSFVPRWTIIRTIRRQSVAEHSFYVALWADRVAELLGVNDLSIRYQLGRHALVHDMPEIVTGDIPSPFKRLLNEDEFRRIEDEFVPKVLSSSDYDRHISPLVKMIIKVADLIEALVFVYEEMQFGNKSLHGVAGEILVKLHAAWGRLPWVDEIERIANFNNHILTLKDHHFKQLSVTVNV